MVFTTVNAEGLQIKKYALKDIYFKLNIIYKILITNIYYPDL